jgi:hypothetical protein
MEIPHTILDPEWMVYRVLKRDRVVGTDAHSKNEISGQLERSIGNLARALIFGIAGYDNALSDFPVYKLKKGTQRISAYHPYAGSNPSRSVTQVQPSDLLGYKLRSSD